MKHHMFILKKNFSSLYSSPARVIMCSFLLVVLIGGFLLSLPISSKDGLHTSFLDSLFTSTSATCVTGLILFDTYSKWTIFGQLVILSLIQIGGIGVITISIFFYVVSGKKLGLRGMHLAKESANIADISNITDLFKFIVATTFSIEAIGATILSFVFVSQYGFARGIYIAVFLAISAFCNAGFDVLGFQSPYVSIMNYNNSPIVIYTLSILIILGGLGFIVWYDLFSNKKHRLLIHTKVVLIMAGILVFLGAVIFLILERNNPYTLKNFSFFEQLNSSVFQSSTLRTAGFSSVDFANTRPITKIISGILMFIGGAPGSTSGGIKTTTLAILVMTAVSVIKNKSETVILKHRVDKNIVYRAICMFLLSIIIIMVGTLLVYYSIKSDYVVNIVNSLFETVSAFSTVGVSSGVTTATNYFGRTVLMVLMFVGRIGPISLLLSLAMKNKDEAHKIYPEGKIMVT